MDSFAPASVTTVERASGRQSGASSSRGVITPPPLDPKLSMIPELLSDITDRHLDQLRTFYGQEVLNLSAGESGFPKAVVPCASSAEIAALVSNGSTAQIAALLSNVTIAPEAKPLFEDLETRIQNIWLREPIWEKKRLLPAYELCTKEGQRALQALEIKKFLLDQFCYENLDKIEVFRKDLAEDRGESNSYRPGRFT